MNKEENDNHILIEVLNKNGDLKLTKFRNPRVIWKNNDYPDEYIFRDVDIVNIFQLQQENHELKKQIEYLRRSVERKEETITELEHERVPYVNEYVEELKKQLEEKNKPQIFIDTQDIEERYAEGLYQDYLEEENKKYKNQQKEFIKWLENEKNIYPYDISDYTYEDIINTILSKYYEIIDK